MSEKNKNIDKIKKKGMKEIDVFSDDFQVELQEDAISKALEAKIEEYQQEVLQLEEASDFISSENKKTGVSLTTVELEKIQSSLEDDTDEMEEIQSSLEDDTDEMEIIQNSNVQDTGELKRRLINASNAKEREEEGRPREAGQRKTPPREQQKSRPSGGSQHHSKGKTDSVKDDTGNIGKKARRNTPIIPTSNPAKAEYVKKEADYDGSRRGGGMARPKRAKKKSKVKRNLIIFMCLLLVLLIGYTGVSVYFFDRFTFNTHINGVNVAHLTPNDVKGFINDNIEGYSLTIVKLNGESEVIYGDSIGLAYYDTGEIRALLNDQNPFAWPLSLIIPTTLNTPVGLEFDVNELNRQINNLRAVAYEQVPPEDAVPVFNGEYFEIQPEVLGATLDVERMRELIYQSIHNFTSQINLEHEGLYQLPRFSSESFEVINARDTLNNYLNATITYTMDEDIVVDRSMIIDWISFDENMNTTFYQDRVAAWVNDFADSYDTVGITRYFTTPTGRAVSVSGGFYGWLMDREAEVEALIGNIQRGEVVRREPVYEQRAAVHGGNDWGSTFIQVDLSYQYMWFFQDGVLMLESPVVTGLLGSMATPPGVFFIVEMLRDTILEGAINPDTGVAANPTPVSYWMRVTWAGIGLHDAIWQENFGGDWYQSHGSHGCINMPYEQARDLYALIDLFVPVIIHH